MVVIDCRGHRYTGTTFCGPGNPYGLGCSLQKVTNRVVWQASVVFPGLRGRNNC